VYKKNTIWLASYPKSGNTWFRVFLTNLLSSSETPANINDLAESGIASSRKIFDDYTGLISSDLTFSEIDQLRPDVYRLQSLESSELLFKKVHDKFYLINNNQALFPPEISRGAIYLIRNPLDVLVSFAYHSAKPIESMITVLNDSEYAFCDRTDKLQNQLRQVMGSWSDHVKSWTEQNHIPVHVIRYEDLINKPYETFAKAVQFLAIEKSEEQIKTAIQKSDFEILNKQETESGFKEKMIKANTFFRKGKIGDWKNYLDDNMKNEVIEKHKDTMIKFGYLDSKSKPVF